MDQRRQEPLLALHPAEVRGAVDMPGADVLEGLPAVERRLPGGQIEAAVAVLQRPYGADVHPADGVHAAHEAGEVDLQVVVDVHTRHVLDGADRQPRPALGVRRVQLDGVPGPRPPGRGVLVGGDLGVRVARQADDAGVVPPGGQVHQHQGVGAVTGRAAQVVLPLLRGRDLVPAVGADDEEVQPVAAGGPVPLLHPLERVDPSDTVLHAGDHGVPDAARGHQQHRDGGGDPQPPALAR